MLKNLFYIVAFTAFVTLVWIFLGIYHNITASTISGTTEIQINPISPVFDTKALSELESRVNVPSDLSGNIVFPTNSPTIPVAGSGSAQTRPTIQPSPTLTPSQQVSSVPVSGVASTPTPIPSSGPTPTPVL